MPVIYATSQGNRVIHTYLDQPDQYGQGGLRALCGASSHKMNKVRPDVFQLVEIRARRCKKCRVLEAGKGIDTPHVYGEDKGKYKPRQGKGKTMTTQAKAQEPQLVTHNDLRIEQIEKMLAELAAGMELLIESRTELRETVHQMRQENELRTSRTYKRFDEAAEQLKRTRVAIGDDTRTFWNARATKLVKEMHNLGQYVEENVDKLADKLDNAIRQVAENAPVKPPAAPQQPPAEPEEWTKARAMPSTLECGPALIRAVKRAVAAQPDTYIRKGVKASKFKPLARLISEHPVWKLNHDQPVSDSTLRYLEAGLTRYPNGQFGRLMTEKRAETWLVILELEGYGDPGPKSVSGKVIEEAMQEIRSATENITTDTSAAR